MGPPTGPDRQPVTGWQRSLVLGIDRFIYKFSRRWLLWFNVVVGIYVGLPLAAPLLMQAGATGPARAIYVAYSPMCHQMATRSFFIGGEQLAYPRELAGTDLKPFEAYAASLPEFQGVGQADENWAEIFANARRFLGNAQMGYKTALCQRDMAIYGFILLAGIGYAILRRRYDIRALPFWAFVIFGMGPIGLDGFSQLFGYFGLGQEGILGTLFGLFPVRESPPWLRTATGAWFGLCLVWLAYPHINDGMRQSVADLQEKLERVGAI